MIEFKAECGHTVRAKDEDAGGVVRCSYCGRTAPVPENENTDLSFLFTDVELQRNAGAKAARPWLGRFFRKRASRRSFDPFSLVFHLCYAALLVIVVVVVVRKFVMPLFDPDSRARRFAAGAADAEPTENSAATTPKRDSRALGLSGVVNSSGMYVASTPNGASVFCLEESKAPANGRIGAHGSCTRFQANGQPPRVSDGTYVVEVAFAWNDPRLSDSSLGHHNQYVQFRRAVEKASVAARTQLVNQFFLPDEATNVFVDEAPDQIYLVRQYRGVTVRQGMSPGVRALFLPRIQTRDDGYFAIEPLLNRYIPEEKPYNFDQVHVTNELSYYGVALADQPYVIQALSRVGQIPYATTDGMVRLFKIGIHDGVFATRLLGSAKP